MNGARETDALEAAAQKGGARANLLIGLAAIILLGGLGFVEYRRQATARALVERLEAAESLAETALSAVIEPATLEAAQGSVYMVQHKGSHGSAFVIDRANGVLATAAHVAEDFDFEDPETDVEIVNSAGGRRIKVRGAKLHAGYGAFRRLAERYQPIDPQSPVTSPAPVPLKDLPHDAGLLFVDPIDPETGAYVLGPDLKVANEETLLALKIGEPVAGVGFSADVINESSQQISAAPRTDRGVVSALLSPIDIAEEPDDPYVQTLIVHRMSTAPGMSGAPLLNRRGEVVGIHTHGVQSIFSNGDSVAQRADVIHDMLTPLQEERRLAELHLPDWRRRLARWPKAEDALPTAFYASYTEKFNNPDDRMLANYLDPEGADALRRKGVRVGVFEAEVAERVSKYIAYAPELAAKPMENQPNASNAESAPPNARRRRGPSQLVNVEQLPGFEIEPGGQFFERDLALSQRKHNLVFAFDYTLGRNPICRLGLHTRWRGQEWMRGTRRSAYPRQFLRAKKKGKGIARLQLVVRKPNCPYSDDRFLIGVIGWDPEKEDEAQGAAAVIEALFDDAADRAALIEAGGLVGAAATLRNTADCGATALLRRVGGEQRGGGCVTRISAGVFENAETRRIAEGFSAQGFSDEDGLLAIGEEAALTLEPVSAELNYGAPQ